jgi:hypothetical protein
VWLALVVVVLLVAVWFLAQRGQKTASGWAPGVHGASPQQYSSSMTAAGSRPLTILEDKARARGD